MRAYEYARQGMESPEMKKNLIVVRSLKSLILFRPAYITYCVQQRDIHPALARDLGYAMNSGAHLVSLRRSASGTFRADVKL